jgi:hypothetical protein
MRQLSRELRHRQAGSGLVDYLVLTAAVAAILFPVLQRAVFGPLEEAIFSQREGLVNFIGQSRKQPVPNEWFGAKEAKQVQGTRFQDQTLEPGQDIDAPGAIDDPKALAAQNIDNPKAIQNPSKIDTSAIGRPDSIAPPGELSAGRLDSGQLGASGGGGGGGGAGAGAGGDFFAGNAGKGGGAKVGEAVADVSRNESKGSRRGGGGFDIEEVTSGGGETAVAKQSKADKSDGNKSQQAVAGGVEARKRAMAAESEARADIDRRSSKIDWSKVIRTLILLLILFLVMLILLSNAKRVGGGR